MDQVAPPESHGVRPAVASLPVVARWSMVAAVVLAACGGVAGLVAGLIAYPPTAWFAVLEIGVPAGVLGGLIGAAAGGVAQVLGRT